MSTQLSVPASRELSADSVESMVNAILDLAEKELWAENKDYDTRPQRQKQAEICSRAVEIAQRSQLVGDLVIGSIVAIIESQELYNELGFSSYEQWLESQQSMSEVSDQAIIASVIVPVATSSIESGGLGLSYNQVILDIGIAKLRILVPSVRTIIASGKDDGVCKEEICALLTKAMLTPVKELSRELTKPRKVIPRPDVEIHGESVTLLWTLTQKDWQWLFRKVERNLESEDAV